ncbi:Hypothetical predicted protein [Olea europaea subsp. europaea]|uniref:Uncharacterized protein n=1 Tax=Olea europaea subsp. europaea TaxID=158383 RepID=A0A8S0TXN2_OLEEU|nr:Hypothetical predicted protein [Olea europaea subsp. europaea]
MSKRAWWSWQNLVLHPSGMAVGTDLSGSSKYSNGKAEEGKGSVLIDPKGLEKPNRQRVSRMHQKGIELKFLDQDGAIGSNVRESKDVDRGLKKSYLFYLTTCPPWKRLSWREWKLAKWIRNFEKRIGSKAGHGDPSLEPVNCQWTVQAASMGRACQYVSVGGCTENDSFRSLPRHRTVDSELVRTRRI